MGSAPRRRRAWTRLQLSLLALVAAGCGRWDPPAGARQAGEAVLGGALPPSPDAYAVTPPASVVQPDFVGEDLPDWVDLRRDDVLPPVPNQSWNSCVGWSLGYFLMAALEARDKRRQDGCLDMGSPDNWFSPDYVYSQRELTELELSPYEYYLEGEPLCRETDRTLGCMRPERAIRSMMQHGCARWTFLCTDSPLLPYRDCVDVVTPRVPTSSVAPWRFAEPGGYYFRPRCVVRFGPLRDQDIRTGTVRQLQGWLYAQGTPVAVIVRATAGWVRYRGENRFRVPVPFRDRQGAPGEDASLFEERGLCLDAGGPDLGGLHMMTIVGYDRRFPTAAQGSGTGDEARGSFLVANSWGTKWGDGGYMWIPVTELKSIWVAAYGLIKWRWETPIPGDVVSCAQGDDGRWVEQSSDCDDVPIDLRPGEGPPRRVIVARPLEPVEEPTRLTTGLQSVGGVTTPCDPGSTASVVDGADWFQVQVGEGVARLEVEFDPATGVQIGVSSGPPPTPLLAPLRRVLDVRITDEDLRDLTEVDPATGATFARICGAGSRTCFIKVAPNERDLYRAVAAFRRTQFPAVGYQLLARLVEGPRDCGPAQADAGPAPALLEHTFAPETIVASERGGPRYHWIDAAGRGHRESWGGNTRIRCEVRDVTPGCRLQVVMGGYCAPRYRAIDSITVGDEGATWFQTESSELFGAHEPAFYVRNLTPDRDVSYTLTVSVLPAAGTRTPSPPPIREAYDAWSATEPRHLGYADRDGYGGWLLECPVGASCGDVGVEPMVRLMRDSWGNHLEGQGIRDYVVELRHGDRAPSIELVHPEGRPLPAGVRLEDAPNAGGVQTPGVIRKRLVVPATYQDDVYGYVRDAEGRPLRDFSLRTRLRTSLSFWPVFEGIVDGAASAWDRNNGPGHATPLALDLPHPDKLGFFERATSKGDAYSWDLYDYFIVENTSQTEDLSVVVSKDLGESVNVRWWPDANAEPSSHWLGPAEPLGRFPMKLPRGASRLLLVFSGTQAPTEYSIEVTTDAL